MMDGVWCPCCNGRVIISAGEVFTRSASGLEMAMARSATCTACPWTSELEGGDWLLDARPMRLDDLRAPFGPADGADWRTRAVGPSATSPLRGRSDS